jgi:hypothetical protein
MAGTEDEPLSRRQIEEKIVALAWKDEGFRKAFLADPKAAFEQRLGIALPAGVKMAAHAEDENHLYFVLPARPQSAELSDEDLEKIAGGFDLVFGATVLMATAAVGSAIAGVNTVKNEHWGST